MDKFAYHAVTMFEFRLAVFGIGAFLEETRYAVVERLTGVSATVLDQVVGPLARGMSDVASVVSEILGPVTSAALGILRSGHLFTAPRTGGPGHP